MDFLAKVPKGSFLRRNAAGILLHFVCLPATGFSQVPYNPVQLPSACQAAVDSLCTSIQEGIIDASTYVHGTVPEICKDVADQAWVWVGQCLNLVLDPIDDAIDEVKEKICRSIPPGAGPQCQTLCDKCLVKPLEDTAIDIGLGFLDGITGLPITEGKECNEAMDKLREALRKISNGGAPDEGFGKLVCGATKCLTEAAKEALKENPYGSALLNVCKYGSKVGWLIECGAAYKACNDNLEKIKPLPQCPDIPIVKPCASGSTQPPTDADLRGQCAKAYDERHPESSNTLEDQQRPSCIEECVTRGKDAKCEYEDCNKEGATVGNTLCLAVTGCPYIRAGYNSDNKFEDNSKDMCGGDAYCLAPTEENKKKFHALFSDPYCLCLKGNRTDCWQLKAPSKNSDECEQGQQRCAVANWNPLLQGTSSVCCVAPPGCNPLAQGGGCAVMSGGLPPTPPPTPSPSVDPPTSPPSVGPPTPPPSVDPPTPPPTPPPSVDPPPPTPPPSVDPPTPTPPPPPACGGTIVQCGAGSCPPRDYPNHCVCTPTLVNGLWMDMCGQEAPEPGPCNKGCVYDKGFCQCCNPPLAYNPATGFCQ
ncbi:MAG: hypothetical protein RIQ81_673 [Pseudomonadota bacterium]|jgi:hypothetical protein